MPHTYWLRSYLQAKQTKQYTIRHSSTASESRDVAGITLESRHKALSHEKQCTTDKVNRQSNNHVVLHWTETCFRPISPSYFPKNLPVWTGAETYVWPIGNVYLFIQRIGLQRRKSADSALTSVHYKNSLSPEWHPTAKNRIIMNWENKIILSLCHLTNNVVCFQWKKRR